MYATIRTYPGNSDLADQLAGYRGDIEELLTSIPGFRSWVCVKADNGCTTITVCDDKAGTEESTRRAAAWLTEHASEISFSKPEVTGGEVTIDLGVTAKV